MYSEEQQKVGHKRAYFIAMFAGSLLLFAISVALVERDINPVRLFFQLIATEFAVAILLVVFLEVFRRISFLNGEAQEALNLAKINNAKVSDLQKSVEQMLSIANNHIVQDNLGSSYTSRPEYYTEYYSLISNAQKTVKLVGDGFHCHTAQNESRALGLYNAMKTAVRNGATVSRFQYHNTLSIKWLRLLLNLVESTRTDDKFIVYMDSERDPSTIPYVICLTDQDEEFASTNVMFTMNADTLLEEKLGGPAFIFQNAKDCTSKMDLVVQDYFQKESRMTTHKLKLLMSRITNERKKIVSDYLAQKDIPKHEQSFIRLIREKTGVPDLEIIDQCLAEKLGVERVLYFAFGSNLSEARIAVNERAPSSLCIDRGFISDHEICFNIRGSASEAAGGGIANVRHQPGKRVYGSLYLMNLEDFKRLEVLEKEMGYETIELEVDKQGFGVVKANAFVSKTKSRKEIKPTMQYAEFISTGMDAHYFPSDYIAQVRKKMYE